MIISCTKFEPFGDRACEHIPNPPKPLEAKSTCALFSGPEDSVNFERQLYYKGCSVIISSDEALERIYSVKTPVLKAFWGHFAPQKSYTNPVGSNGQGDRSTCESVSNVLKKKKKEGSLGKEDSETEHRTGGLRKALCVLEKSYITLFFADGTEFMIRLPFVVRGVWPLCEGLLFERNVDKDGKRKLHIPHLFSLLNEHDEIRPVCLPDDITKERVLHADCVYPLVATYRTETNQISLWACERLKETKASLYSDEVNMEEGPLPEDYSLAPVLALRQLWCESVPTSAQTCRLDYSVFCVRVLSGEILVCFSCSKGSNIFCVPLREIHEKKHDVNMVDIDIDCPSEGKIMIHNKPFRVGTLFGIFGKAAVPLSVSYSFEGDVLHRDMPQEILVMKDEKSFAVYSGKTLVYSFDGREFGFPCDIKEFCSFANNLCLLKTRSNVLYKLEMNFFCSNFARTCLNSLLVLLPVDIVFDIQMQYLKYFDKLEESKSFQNYLDNDLNRFFGTLCDMIGMRTVNDTTPPAVDKLTDWQFFLLHSKGIPCPNLLDVSSTRVNTSKQRAFDTEHEVVEDEGALQKYMCELLFSLHLVYEELKLNTLCTHYLKPFASFLLTLSKIMDWVDYSDYYYRDFASLKPFRALKGESSCTSYDIPEYLRKFVSSKVPPSFAEWSHLVFDSFRSSSARTKLIRAFPLLINFLQPSFYASGKQLCRSISSSICRITRILYHVYLELVYFNSGDTSRDYSLTHQFICEDNLRKKRNLGKGLPLVERYFDAKEICDSCRIIPSDLQCNSVMEAAVLVMYAENLSTGDLEGIPFGYCQPLRQVIYDLKVSHPLPSNWSQQLYDFIGREDMTANMFSPSPSLKIDDALDYEQELIPSYFLDQNLSEGVDDADKALLDNEIIKMRFGRDLRILEVYQLLQSSRPAILFLKTEPEMSDHDIMAQQQLKLIKMAQRTMSVSVGRGMFSLNSAESTFTEPISIPQMNLNGKLTNSNNYISLEAASIPQDMMDWPQFHNGVASSLRINSSHTCSSSSWIAFNKPKNPISHSDSCAHAGFLMAMGLQNNLEHLGTIDLYDYLSKGHDLTSIALLLGMASNKRGSMDSVTTKMLSIHIPALLPPSSAELDVAPLVQTAAVLGIGLLYQGTAYRRVTEVLLSEIGRKPLLDGSVESVQEHDCYSLTAGFALGFVTLGKGNNAVGIEDLKIPDQLKGYLVGCTKGASVSQTYVASGCNSVISQTQSEVHKNALYTYRSSTLESSFANLNPKDAVNDVNVDVTSPAACVALGLMYLKTNNKAIASHLNVPDTHFLLDYVRPDFLLLRLVCKYLILWNDVESTVDWVKKQIPEAYGTGNTLAELIGRHGKVNNNIFGLSGTDMETMRLAKLNIVAGAAFAIGFRYIGSADEEAFETLIHILDIFERLAEEHDRLTLPTIENCTNMIALSVSMVMAGTGNLKALRLMRIVRAKISSDLLYGSHMAIHMAIGLLFLGGGMYSLSPSNESIAALLCSLYPRFPIISGDNRYHLQAFRHLYVLSIQPRAIITRDVFSNHPCYVPLEIVLKESPEHSETVLNLFSPCLVPELSKIKCIRIVSPRYFNVELDLGSNGELQAQLFRTRTVYVQRKTGYLSYMRDPKGFRNILSRTFPNSSNSIVDTSFPSEEGYETHKIIRSFSSDPFVISFADALCFKEKHGSESAHEARFAQFCDSILYETLTEDKTKMLKVYLKVYEAVEKMGDANNDSTIGFQNLVLLFHFYQDFNLCIGTRQLIQKEFLSLSKSAVESSLSSFFIDRKQLRQLAGRSDPENPSNIVGPRGFGGRKKSAIKSSFLEYVQKCLSLSVGSPGGDDTLLDGHEEGIFRNHTFGCFLHYYRIPCPSLCGDVFRALVEDCHDENFDHTELSPMATTSAWENTLLFSSSLPTCNNKIKNPDVKRPLDSGTDHLNTCEPHLSFSASFNILKAINSL